MKISEAKLRQLIREELEFTVGDLRLALDAAKGKKLAAAAKEVGKTAAEKGTMAILGLFPGAISLVTAIEGGLAVKDIYKAATSMSPEEKKSNPLWDYLSIDHDTSQIVDDAVEQNFINNMSKQVQNLPDEAKLPDIDTQLNNWLSQKYNNTKISKQKK